MAVTTWWLQPWENLGSVQIKIDVDPTTIRGHKSKYGPALIIPFKIEPIPQPSAEVTLHSLEGWIVWQSEQGMEPGIRIPSQVVGPNRNSLFVPLTYDLVDLIELARGGEELIVRIALTGMATIPNPRERIGHYVRQQDWTNRIELKPRLEIHEIHGQGDGAQQLVIGLETWLKILEGFGTAAWRLVALPTPNLPTESDVRWQECIRLLNSSIQHFRQGAYEAALDDCRKVVEGTAKALCDYWKMPWDRKKNFEDRMKELGGRMESQWPNDKPAAHMLTGLFTSAWTWLSPSHHFGSGIPQREEVAFALSLTTDLLAFAPQIIKAHPKSQEAQEELEANTQSS
jgi:hypothetical protein